MASLRISMWNSNCVSLKLAQFLLDKHIDVMLLSETHLTNMYNFKLRDYLFFAITKNISRSLISA